MQNKPLAPETRAFISPVVLEKRELEGGASVNVISGYAFKYNVRSLILGWGFREEILPGALVDCDMSDVICRSYHSDNHILGRSTSKTLRLFPDEIGLRFECDLPDSTAGRDILALITRGDIDACSFEFYLKEDAWGYDENNIPLRSVRSFSRITDVAPVSRPAYPNTELARRSFDLANTPPPSAVPFRRQMAARKMRIN